MRLQLIFTNHARCLAGVRAFTRETLRQWPFAEAVAEKLGECVIAAASNAIDHAYPVGEEGSIELTIREQGGKFQFLVRDYGLPIDAAELERQLHDSSVSGESEDHRVVAWVRRRRRVPLDRLWPRWQGNPDREVAA